MFKEFEHEDIFICEEEDENSESEPQQSQRNTLKEEAREKEKENHDIFVFDDDDNHYEEEIVYSKQSEFKMKDLEKRMSKEEYESKCSELQDRIIFTNMTNFTSNVVKPQKNFFEEAKIRRRESEMVRQKRGSIVDTINAFPSKQQQVKVDFVVAAPNEIKNESNFTENAASHRPAVNIEDSFDDDISEER